MPNIRTHLIISGRVQGVNYRAWCRNLAKKSRIFGWVRNLDDGTVEALLEGNRDDVELFIENLKKGPALASVKSVHREDEQYVGELFDFEIRS